MVIEFPSAGTTSGDARRSADRDPPAVDRGIGHRSKAASTPCSDALCEPKPVQRPHPPIVIGGEKPKMLRVVARHADEWNVPSHGDVAEWARISADARRGVRGDRPGSGRDPALGAAVHPTRRRRALGRAAGHASRTGSRRLRACRAVVLSTADGTAAGALLQRLGAGSAFLLDGPGIHRGSSAPD